MLQMIRFTIREVLIITLVVGLAIGWCLDHKTMAASRIAVRLHAEQLRSALIAAQYNESYRSYPIRTGNSPCGFTLLVNWKLTEEPIPYQDWLKLKDEERRKAGLSIAKELGDDK